jgi:hypothetical protein
MCQMYQPITGVVRWGCAYRGQLPGGRDVSSACMNAELRLRSTTWAPLDRSETSTKVMLESNQGLYALCSIRLHVYAHMLNACDRECKSVTKSAQIFKPWVL